MFRGPLRFIFSDPGQHRPLQMRLLRHDQRNNMSTLGSQTVVPFTIFTDASPEFGALPYAVISHHKGTDRTAGADRRRGGAYQYPLIVFDAGTPIPIVLRRDLYL